MVTLDDMTVACDELMNFVLQRSDEIRAFLDSEDGFFQILAYTNTWPQPRNRDTLGVTVIIRRANELDAFLGEDRPPTIAFGTCPNP